MSRLYDRIMSRGAAPQGHLSKEIAGYSGQALELAMVVTADEPAAYWAANLAGEQLLDVADLPNIAPPFEIAFVEYKWPNPYLADSHHMSEKALVSTGLRLKRVGVLLYYVDLEADDEAYTAHRDTGFLKGFMGKLEAGVRWILNAQLYAEIAGDPRPIGPLSTHYMGIDSSGSLCEHEGALPVASVLFDETKGTAFEDDRDAREGRNHQMMTLLDPALLAICFAHCKNVELVPNEPPRKLSRKHERKHGRPLTRYYTLDIDPAKRLLKTEGNIEKTGLKKALHLTRGHFRTYSKEKPLFGKYAGTVWVSQHMRGSKEQGEIVKDYAVKAPRTH